jgi:hypothetical protein
MVEHVIGKPMPWLVLPIAANPATVQVWNGC